MERYSPKQIAVRILDNAGAIQHSNSAQQFSTAIQHSNSAQWYCNHRFMLYVAGHRSCLFK